MPILTEEEKHQAAEALRAFADRLLHEEGLVIEDFRFEKHAETREITPIAGWRQYEQTGRRWICGEVRLSWTEGALKPVGHSIHRAE